MRVKIVEIWLKIRAGYDDKMMLGRSASQRGKPKWQKCANYNGLSDGRWSEDLTSGAEKQTIYHACCCSIPSGTKKTWHCSKKCSCHLSQTLIQLKTKIVENSRTLNEITASNDYEVRCNVELTPSEEKLFSVGIVKDDSVVCCVLVRQLRAQKRDLEVMIEQWVEFVEKADRFRYLVAEMREKLAELTPRIESILRETKVLEEIELENEEARKWEIDEELRRSEARRESFREAVDRCVEAEVRDHSTQLARRENLNVLDRDKFMDRDALKPALRRMIKAAEDTRAFPKTMTVTSPVGDQSANSANPPCEKAIVIQGSEQNRSAICCTRTKARRPF